MSDRRKDRRVIGTVQKWLKWLTQDSRKLFPNGHGNDLGWDFLKAPDVVMCPEPECFARFPDFNVELRLSLRGPHLKCSALLAFCLFFFVDQIYFHFEEKNT